MGTTVLKHYFRPGREDFRQHLLKAMPHIIGQTPDNAPADQLLEILHHMTVRSWRRDRDRRLAILCPQTEGTGTSLNPRTPPGLTGSRRAEAPTHLPGR